MKKVLLATSALALTAGVAHAEITFSGKAEAGIYRSAPTAAVAAVQGKKTIAFTGAAAAAGGVNVATGVAIKVAPATTTSTNSDATTLAAAKVLLDAANAELGQVQHIVNNGLALDRNASTLVDYSTIATADAAAGGALADMKIRADALAYAQARQSAAQLAYDAELGKAAVAKGAMPKSVAYSGYDFNVVASATTDSGMTFGVDFDMGAGLIADQDDDRAMDAQAAAVAEGKVTMSYNGVNIAIKQDGIDDLYDDTQNGDVSVSGSFAGLSYTVVTDLDDDVKAVAATDAVWTNSTTSGEDTFVAAKAATAAVYNPTSVSLGYTAGDLALSYVGTEHSDNGSAANKISATYTMGDLKVTLANDSKGDLKDVSSISLAYAKDGLGVTLTVKDDANHVLNTNKSGKQSQDIKVTYAAGALGFTAATDESSNWWVNAQYDLGGGAQAFTTLDHTDFAVVGVNFAF